LVATGVTATLKSGGGSRGTASSHLHPPPPLHLHLSSSSASRGLVAGGVTSAEKSGSGSRGRIRHRRGDALIDGEITPSFKAPITSRRALERRSRAPELWTIYSRRRAAAHLRRLLRPALAAVPVRLHLGERRCTIVGERKRAPSRAAAGRMQHDSIWFSPRGRGDENGAGLYDGGIGCLLFSI
jgi:hypothetical protein